MRSSAFWTVGASLLLSCSSAMAKELVVGVENIDYLPYYGLEKSEYKGFMREMLDAFAKKNGHTIKYSPLPVARLFRDMIDGKLDMKMPDNPNWSADDKKSAKLVYSDPVVSAREAVLVRSEKAASLKPEQIKIVGTVTGFTAFAILENIKSGKIKIKENSSLSGLIGQVLGDRIDGAYVEDRVARNLLKKEGKSGNELSIFSGLPVDEHPFMVSVQEKHADVSKELNAFLTTDEARKLYSKWDVILKK